ncbi:hypothetical protein HF086_012921 [Spodoptera exigua]|uniref:C2H2-type domain-containing protein n=1 Tax=Spodoptera exigua TaxID=7107 RepID=A0A922MLP1_SPOEX|nr:hypothetical protein HF086_012921 [Spodoptera exigua]
MDKNAYETYEFLPTNSSETEPDQFFVLQDDGTFLLNRQIQYVAQVQDVKEVLEDVQPCTVYGVSSQQFFVDVDNSAELISVSGDFEQNQFILPDGDNGLYSNSFLLQPSTSGNTEPMEEDVVVDEYKQQNTQDVDVDIDVVTYTSKQGNNFTEITISDEQYQMLEQKGWILLESNDKIFVLNTLGLHDITTNDKLVQKLKNETQNVTGNIMGANEGTLKIETISGQFPNIGTESLSDQQETVEFVIKADEPNNTIEGIQFVVDDKDIPEKIVLGKTANGKRLVAKVLKPQSNKIERPKDNQVLKQVEENPHYNIPERPVTTGLHEMDFVNLIQTTLRAGIQPSCTEEDIASAEGVITQLLKMPNLKHFLVGYDLIVTKAKNNKNEFGLIYNRSPVSFITGRVADKDGSCGFEHVPNLLQTIKQKAELPVNLVFDLKKRYPTTVFGCSSCAALFKTEQTLKDHQEVTFTKLSNIQRHMKSHLGTKQQILQTTRVLKQDLDPKQKPTKIFKCKMCPSTYFHSASLSKHIVTRHIKVKSNKNGN